MERFIKYRPKFFDDAAVNQLCKNTHAVWSVEEKETARVYNVLPLYLPTGGDGRVFAVVDGAGGLDRDNVLHRDVQRSVHSSEQDSGLELAAFSHQLSRSVVGCRL